MNCVDIQLLSPFTGLSPLTLEDAAEHVGHAYIVLKETGMLEPAPKGAPASKAIPKLDRPEDAIHRIRDGTTVWDGYDVGQHDFGGDDQGGQLFQG